LLAHGTRDNAIPLESVRAAAALLPKAELELLEGRGHLAHEEDPERAIRLIIDFAAQQAAGG